MKTIIRDQKELETFIANNGDYNPDITYLSQNKEDECFAIFGCTHASEAFDLLSMDDDYVLVVTDDDYDREIEEQTNSAHPENAGFFLKQD